MTTETYRELCESVELIADAAERYSGGQPFLEEWRKWARGVLGGLYYSKTARRAAHSAELAAFGCGRDYARAGVARAAALAATGVACAALKNEHDARANAAAARDIVQSIDARHHGRGGRRAGPG